MDITKKEIAYDSVGGGRDDVDSASPSPVSLDAYVGTLDFATLLDDDQLGEILARWFCLYASQDMREAPEAILARVVESCYFQAQRYCLCTDEEQTSTYPEKWEQFKQSTLFSYLTTSKAPWGNRICVVPNDKKMSLRRLLATWYSVVKHTMDTSLLKRYLSSEDLLPTARSMSWCRDNFVTDTQTMLNIPVHHATIQDGTPDGSSLSTRSRARTRGVRYEKPASLHYKKIDGLLEKISLLLKEDDYVSCTLHVSPAWTKMLVVQIARLNGVDRCKTVVMCDDLQPRATYVLDGVACLEDFVADAGYKFTIHDVYQCLIWAKNQQPDKVHRVLLARTDQHLDSWTVVKTLNYIFNPAQIVKMWDDAAADLRMILHDLYHQDPDRLLPLFAADSYHKHAHKLNKYLESCDAWQHDAYLSTLSYHSFLETLKDPKITFPNFKMHENYVHYSVMDLRELPDRDMMSCLLADMFCDGDLSALEDTLSQISNADFRPRVKERNKELTTDAQKRRYLFDSLGYTQQYLGMRW